MHKFTLGQLRARPITPQNFQPYGQVIFAVPDGKSYDGEDAQLQLQNGLPRFYIMRLHQRGRKFHQLARHVKCTQCLGALEGKDWSIAVAPPSPVGESYVSPEAIAAFRIPGNCFIKLNLGTWHAGPYFDSEFVDFYNLELSDTNECDRDICDLRESHGLELEIV